MMGLHSPALRGSPRGALSTLRGPLFVAVLGLLVSGPATVHAGGFSIAPVRLFFSEKDRAVALRVSNDGDTELVLQTDVQSWSQDEQGLDRLEPSDELIVSPPMLRLKPKADQIVRVILAAPRRADRQMTYRLLVREIPAPPDRPGEVQLPIALALSLPVFITPPKARHQLNCAWQSASPTPVAACENKGRAFARIGKLELLEGASVIGRFEGSAYLLPGSRRSLPLTPVADGPAGRGTALQALLDNAETVRFEPEPLASARR